MIYFGEAHGFAVDLQPRAIVPAIVFYSLKPSLGDVGSGYHSLYGDASASFTADSNTHLGFGAGQWLDHGFGGETYYLRIPHPAITALLVMAIAIVSRGLLRRVKPGCCVGCGYDLRATPDRCPECGRLAKPAVTVNPS